MKSNGKNVETKQSNHRKGTRRARNWWLVPVVAMLGLSVTLDTATAVAASLDDFIDFSGSIPGRMYVPPEAADLDSPRPLILFLHGYTSGGLSVRTSVPVPLEHREVE